MVLGLAHRSRALPAGSTWRSSGAATPRGRRPCSCPASPRRCPSWYATMGSRRACPAISSIASRRRQHRGPAPDGDHHADRRTGITPGTGCAAPGHHGGETELPICHLFFSWGLSRRRPGFAIAGSRWTPRASCAPGRTSTRLGPCRWSRASRACSRSGMSAPGPRSEWAGRSARAPRWSRRSIPCSRTPRRRGADQSRHAGGPRRVPEPEASRARAAARRPLVRRLGRRSPRRRGRAQRGGHPRARVGRGAEPHRECTASACDMSWGACSAGTRCPCDPKSRCCRACLSATVATPRSPPAPATARSFSVPVSRRGAARDPQCHGARVRLHGPGAHRDRVPSVLGVYVRPVSRLTRPYLIAIEPFRRFILYSAMLRRIRRAWLAAYGAATDSR